MHTLLYTKKRKLPLSHGLSVHTCIVRPQSRGVLGLNSKNPLDIPRFVYNYFQKKEDLDKLIKATLLVNKVLRDKAFKNIITDYCDFEG